MSKWLKESRDLYEAVIRKRPDLDVPILKNMKHALYYILIYYDYNPFTGQLLSRDNDKDYTFTLKSGYRYLKMKGIFYPVYKLAFMFMNGWYPDTTVQIRHRDNDKQNDAWYNLEVYYNPMWVNKKIKNGKLINTPPSIRWNAAVSFSDVRVNENSLSVGNGKVRFKIPFKNNKLNGEIIWADKSVYRYKDGKLHGVKKPAIQLSSGIKVYYKNGLIHRKGKPAYIHPTGYKEYWEDGIYQVTGTGHLKDRLPDVYKKYYKAIEERKKSGKKTMIFIRNGRIIDLDDISEETIKATNESY